MTGESESKKQTIDDRRLQVEQLLQKYPVEIGLGVLLPVNAVNQLLTMSQREMRKLTAEECGEASVILNQAATYIQLEMNRIHADLKWCNEYIDWLIADKITQYGTKYTPFEYRRLLAIRDNDVAMKLQVIINNAQLRVKLLEYMPNQLKGTSMSFSDLQQTKRSQRA